MSIQAGRKRDLEEFEIEEFDRELAQAVGPQDQALLSSHKEALEGEKSYVSFQTSTKGVWTFDVKVVGHELDQLAEKAQVLAEKADAFCQRQNGSPLRS